MNSFTLCFALSIIYVATGQESAPSIGLEAGGSLPDAAFSASSTKTALSNARLDSTSGWTPRTEDKDAWIQVDLGVEHELWEITTQGRSDGKPRFIKKYEIELSSDGTTFMNMGETFAANNNKNGKVTNSLNTERARYVRIKPTACQLKNGCALRFNLFGYRVCTDPKFNNQLRGSCYQYISSPANFTTQSNICEHNGGQLASISNSEENVFVARMATSIGNAQRSWIGGTRAGPEEEEFVWLSFEDFTYTNWRQGVNQIEPNNWGKREDCIETNFVRQGMWNDHFCDRLKPAVCEKLASIPI